MTFCFKFRVSDDLFFGLLKSSKKKQHLICYKRDHTKAKLTVTVITLIPRMEKGPFNFDREKIESHYFL